MTLSSLKKKPLTELFPATFLFSLILCNFIQGFRQLLDLTLLNIYKEKMNMEPAELQVYMAIIQIPWSLKFIYQFLSEMVEGNNFKMKKGYIIIINSLINILSMSLVISSGLEKETSKAFITALIFISQINMAYCDSVTDVYLQQLREIMFAQANDFENISDKSYQSRQRLINRI